VLAAIEVLERLDGELADGRNVVLAHGPELGHGDHHRIARPAATARRSAGSAGSSRRAE
jgi:hypothetical protein